MLFFLGSWWDQVSLELGYEGDRGLGIPPQTPVPAASDDGALMGLIGEHTLPTAQTPLGLSIFQQLHFGLNCGAILRPFCNCGDGWGGGTERLLDREVAKHVSRILRVRRRAGVLCNCALSWPPPSWMESESQRGSSREPQQPGAPQEVIFKG